MKTDQIEDIAAQVIAAVADKSPLTLGDVERQIIAALKLHMADKIAIYWDASDVESVRPDLTSEQCADVLDSLLRCHDASIGINWDVIEETADFMYPRECDDDECAAASVDEDEDEDEVS